MTTTAVRTLPYADLADRLTLPDGGFTIDPATGADLDHGYAVSVYPERSADFPAYLTAPEIIAAYINHNQDLLDRPGTAVGGWHDPKSDRVWLDVSIVESDQARAITLAKIHNQIAVFDLDRFQSIDTGGTGEYLPTPDVHAEAALARVETAEQYPRFTADELDVDDLPDPDGSNALPVPHGPWFMQDV